MEGRGAADAANGGGAGRRARAPRGGGAPRGRGGGHVRLARARAASAPLDAVSPAARLGSEGLPVQQRWRYSTIGALTEDAANDLGGRLREEVGDDAEVWVEVNLATCPTRSSSSSDAGR